MAEISKIYRTVSVDSSGHNPSSLNVGSTITVFMSKYLTKSGDLNEKGQQVFGFLNLNPDDLLEKTLEQFIEEEQSSNVGPDKLSKQAIYQNAELKFDRYEKKRHFKAQQIKQHEVAIAMSLKEKDEFSQPKSQMHLLT